MGAMWATGFATFNSGSNGASASSPIVVPGSPADYTNPLASLVTAGSSWAPTWSGDWGSTTATKFFKIDLSSFTSSDTFNIAMLLTNGAALTTAAQAGTGWQTLQLKTDLEASTAGDCSDTDYTTGTSKMFVFDSEDSAVYYNAVPGGSVYCLGIPAATAPYADGSGTFLRAEDATNLPTAYPDFVATLNRAS
jgi:hypothetical protein